MKYTDIPRHQIELLVAHVFKKDRLWVLTHGDTVLSDAHRDSLVRFHAQLMSNQPLAYIVGYKRFYDVDFVINHHVLIPRQETEELVQRIYSLYRSSPKLTFVDIGTGSGCIGLTLARLLPQHQLVLTDTSKQALAIAQENYQIQLSPTNVKFFQGDLLEPLIAEKIYPQIIVANLPYISDTIYADLPTSVAKYEPRLALYGGPDGLDLYRKLLLQIYQYYPLSSYPELWWEISPEQKDLIASLFTDRKVNIEYIKDLNERDRFVRISFKDSSTLPC